MTTASITHITFIDPPNPVCRACHTDAHPASAMQPAFCTECVNAMLHGRDNRLTGLPVAALTDYDYDHEPTFAARYIAPMLTPPADEPDPGPEGPGVPGDERPFTVIEPHPVCSCCETRAYPHGVASVCVLCEQAREWGVDSRWSVIRSTMYCSSCLCVAEQLDTHAWRCRNPACLSPWRLDDLLTLSELIERRASLDRIKCAVMQRLTCAACGGFHATHRCPEAGAALHVGPPDVALGRELVAMLWRQHESFVAMLVNAEPARLIHYAESYAAFMRSHSPQSTLTAERLLARWEREIEGDGPAAPAMMLVAA